MRKFVIAFALVIVSLSYGFTVTQASTKKPDWKAEEKIEERLVDGKIVKVKVYTTLTTYHSNDGLYAVDVYVEEVGFTDEQIEEHPSLRWVPGDKTERLTLKDKNGNVLLDKKYDGSFCEIMFSGDSTAIAYTYGYVDPDELHPNKLVIYDMKGKEIYYKEYSNPTIWISDVKISDDGKYVLFTRNLEVIVCVNIETEAEWEKSLLHEDHAGKAIYKFDENNNVLMHWGNIKRDGQLIMPVYYYSPDGEFIERKVEVKQR